MFTFLRLHRNPTTTLTALGRPQELELSWCGQRLLYSAGASQLDTTETVLATPDSESGEALLDKVQTGAVRRATMVATQHEMRFCAMQSLARMDVLPVLQRTASLALAKLIVGQPTCWLEPMGRLADLGTDLLAVCPTRSVLAGWGDGRRPVRASGPLAEYEQAVRELDVPALPVTPQQAAAAVLELVDASAGLAATAMLCMSQRQTHNAAEAIKLAEQCTPPQPFRLQRAIETTQVGTHILHRGDLLASSVAASEGHATYIRLVALTMLEEMHRLWSFAPQAPALRRVRQAVQPTSLIGTRRLCTLREVSAEVPASIMLELRLRAA